LTFLIEVKISYFESDRRHFWVA